MEKISENDCPGTKQLNLKKSFKQCVGSLLTTLPSDQDFQKAFVRFTAPEQKRLYQIYIQVITCLHSNMEEEFDSLCRETQVGAILDNVDRLVEEQRLDPLFSQKSNLEDLKSDLLAKKKNEAHLLEGLLEKLEDQKHNTKARIKLLKNKNEDISSPPQGVEKLRDLIRNYGSHDDL